MSPLAEALGKIPSGLFILTARLGARQTGMLASFVMQASFQPPMVTVAIRRDRMVADWLRNQAKVGINVLGEDDKALLSVFARGFEPDADVFAGLKLLDRPAPALADALAFLHGHVANSMEAGDHHIFAIRIEDGEMLGEGAPMVHVRKNGLNY